VKIALFHNLYQIRGGEERMYQLEEQALRACGHDVVRYEIDNRKLFANDSFTTKFKTAINAPYNKTAAQSTLSFLEREQPDVGHIHNWFPLFSPAIYTVHRSLGIPVVQSLHNYRLGCASANYHRNGQECTLCSPHNNLPALRHRCYKNSLTGTYTWKRVMDRNWKNGTFTSLVDHYICPSLEVYRRHAQMGVPESKMSVIHNASPDPLELKNKAETANHCEILSIGRLVREKGTHILIEAWKRLPSTITKNARLKIIGTGPESSHLHAQSAGFDNIVFTGELSREETLQSLLQASLLVFPTLWAEPFGLNVIEAMSTNTPVIASDIGGPAELLKDGRCGCLIPPNNIDALRHTLEGMLSQPQQLIEMGLHGRTCYEQNFTPKTHAERLIQCYKKLCKATS
jgi:glycosyltransferase involved in cell wall biosynthesis